MNYLGHAFLSFNVGDILTGNMIADHVKGKAAMDQYPPAIRRGIELHRKIDGHTDVHPATARAKLLFREHYGLYAGPIVDTLYDHFLANDPKFFPDEIALLKFTQTVYEQLDVNAVWLPEKFAAYFPSMKQYNWLYNYRTVKGIERALNGLGRRALYMAPVDKAYEIFITSYYQLNQCYYEFIDDVISFVKTETAPHNS
jgi:acyl carrier protein phosphodiesterase